MSNKYTNPKGTRFFFGKGTSLYMLRTTLFFGTDALLAFTENF